MLFFQDSHKITPFHTRVCFFSYKHREFCKTLDGGGEALARAGSSGRRSEMQGGCAERIPPGVPASVTATLADPKNDTSFQKTRTDEINNNLYEINPLDIIFEPTDKGFRGFQICRFSKG